MHLSPFAKVGILGPTSEHSDLIASVFHTRSWLVIVKKLMAYLNLLLSCLDGLSIFLSHINNKLSCE